MARPTEYNVDVLQRAREYLHQLPEDEAIHSIEGFAQHVGVSRSTIYLWESQKIDQEFSDIVEELREKQAKTLVNKGLKGEFQPSITKVMLTKHGYREGIDQTTNDNDLPSPIINVPRNDSFQEDQQTG